MAPVLERSFFKINKCNMSNLFQTEVLGPLDIDNRLRKSVHIIDISTLTSNDPNESWLGPLLFKDMASSIF